MCANVCCAIYKFSDKLADNSNNKETTKPKRQTIQQRREGEQGIESREGGGGKEREVAREKRPQGANWTILFCKVAKKCAQRKAGEAGTGRGEGTTVKGSVTHR